MSRNCPDDSSDEEEEALSLSDLPLGFTSDEESPLSTNPQDLDPEKEEFEFGSWIGSTSTEKEMCAADELFFKGQILPLSGLTSRSSSLNSTTTSSSSAANNTNATPTRFYQPKIRNQFQTHPSPKPQIRVSNRSHSNRKASVWNLLRVGLVPTPEIGLHDLKVRNVNKNFGRGHNGKYGYIKELKNLDLSKTKDEDTKTRRDRFIRGCKCSVETVSCRIKSSSKKGSAMQQQQEPKKKPIKQRHDVSRHRTSEWLMDLSHANSPHHETVALLA